jgi:hypothetical protein
MIPLLGGSRTHAAKILQGWVPYQRKKGIWIRSGKAQPFFEEGTTTKVQRGKTKYYKPCVERLRPLFSKQASKQAQINASTIHSLGILSRP